MGREELFSFVIACMKISVCPGVPVLKAAPHRIHPNPGRCCQGSMVEAAEFNPFVPAMVELEETELHFNSFWTRHMAGERYWMSRIAARISSHGISMVAVDVLSSQHCQANGPSNRLLFHSYLVVHGNNMVAALVISPREKFIYAFASLCL